MKNCLFFIPVIFFFLSTSSLGLAQPRHVHKTYQQRLNKSRAEQGYTNNGTVIYNYKEIGEYSDDLEGEDIGHLKVERGSHVREVHNTVIIHGDVDSEKDALNIGKVEMDRPGRGSTIENDVTVTGDIKTSGQKTEIGTVRIDRGQFGQVDNSVEISGDIHAK